MHAGDEAQLQEVSPVVGLLEAQQQPDQQQQQTAAEQYGSMGFFGSLCSAPAVNTPGAFQNAYRTTVLASTLTSGSTHASLHAPPTCL